MEILSQMYNIKKNLFRLRATFLSDNLVHIDNEQVGFCRQYLQGYNEGGYNCCYEAYTGERATTKDKGGDVLKEYFPEKKMQIWPHLH